MPRCARSPCLFKPGQGCVGHNHALLAQISDGNSAKCSFGAEWQLKKIMCSAATTLKRNLSVSEAANVPPYAHSPAVSVLARAL